MVIVLDSERMLSIGSFHGLESISFEVMLENKVPEDFVKKLKDYWEWWKANKTGGIITYVREIHHNAWLFKMYRISINNADSLGRPDLFEATLLLTKDSFAEVEAHRYNLDPRIDITWLSHRLTHHFEIDWSGH